jgi:hypothetical protein
MRAGICPGLAGLCAAKVAKHCPHMQPAQALQLIVFPCVSGMILAQPRFFSPAEAADTLLFSGIFVHLLRECDTGSRS